jgi:hypothetical protein
MVPRGVSPTLAIILLVVADAVTVTVMLLLRRRAPEGSFFRDTQQAAGVFTVAGTAYAVLLAFVFLLAFQSYNTARTAAEQEATAVTALFDDADSFAEPGRTGVHGELTCYGRSVVSAGWPAMDQGHSSPLTQQWVDRLDASFGASQPRTPKQQNADANWVTLTSERIDGRRGRLQEAEPFVPGLVWALLIVGSVIVVAFVALFADRRERGFVQAMLMLSVTTMLVAGLLLIKFFDDPYSDAAGSIRPDAMRRSLQTLSDIPSERVLRPPCNAQGEPVRRIA